MCIFILFSLKINQATYPKQYRSVYPHRSRNCLSPLCGIFFFSFSLTIFHLNLSLGTSQSNRIEKQTQDRMQDQLKYNMSFPNYNNKNPCKIWYSIMELNNIYSNCQQYCNKHAGLEVQKQHNFMKNLIFPPISSKWQPFQSFPPIYKCFQTYPAIYSHLHTHRTTETWTLGCTI